jgi:AraC-like DNA-binding protein
MSKQKIDLKTNLSDINLYQCGFETCRPNHTQGPAIRPYYLLHYITKGKGSFLANGVTYHLTPGSAFLISPNQVSLYRADGEAPWEYLWVAFDGIKADHYLRLAGLSKDTPIYKANRGEDIKKALFRLIGEAERSTPSETRLMGYMYLFLSALAENAPRRQAAVPNRKELYIQKSIQYIDFNLWRKITVDELAKHVGLNRSYLCAIFKERLKRSPQEYIIRFRISRACDLLQNTDLLIAEIARLVGYPDQLSFTRMFKQKMGVSPSGFRKNAG